MKVLFDKTYYGFEGAYDIERDVSEMLDPRFNPAAEGLDGEFTQEIRIRVTMRDNSKDRKAKIKELQDEIDNRLEELNNLSKEIDQLRRSHNETQVQ